MKRLLSLLILPIIALICFTGCKGDKTHTDINTLYTTMATSYMIEDKNIFFGDENKPNSITILYDNNIGIAVNNSNPLTDIQKRYVALKYQQIVLDYVFNFYEKHQEKFYATCATGDIEQKDLNRLYEKLENLNNTLKSFSTEYALFVEDADSGVDEIMAFSIINYTYHVNLVIDRAFDFMYEFISMYEKYCVDTTKITEDSLEYYVNKSYVDIAHIAYLENIQAFNYTVGEKGVCDLIGIVNTSSKFALVNKLTGVKSLSQEIVSNMEETSAHYDSTISKINEYLYAKDVFYQKVQAYSQVVKMVDMYTLNQYRFNQISGVGYDNYVKTLSISNRANVEMLETFVEDHYNSFINKLQLLTI